ncbi:MAG: ABC transporter substrate-binding protein [Myxococcaceae bacterium]|nr:ABC transporter substrate-binding protein [Myxococcaceae bacterium]
MLRGSALALVLASAAALGADRPKVVIVKSAELSPYAALAAGFSVEVRGQVEQLTLDESAEGAARTFKQVAERKPALVLAIGPAAAVGAHRALTDVPIIFAMVPYFEKYELEGPHITGIALTSDLSLELAAVKALLPEVKRVGVVEDPRFSQKLIDGASGLAAGQGLSLVPLEIDGPARLEKVLKGAKGKVDALVMISDRTVGNAAVVERLIAWSTEEKVPAIGLAPGQVKEGALLALAPAPTGLGLQAGRLANRILHEKVDPGALAVAPPEGVDLHCNLKTARALVDPRKFALDLVTFAASKGLAVKVTE